VSKDWRTILRFEILGLAITAFFFMFDRVDFFTKSWIEGWIFLASLVACPGYFLFVAYVAGGEVPVSDSALAWSIIGLFNSAYYATLGIVYIDMRKPRGSAAKI
jgi:hypothetical protein